MSLEINYGEVLRRFVAEGLEVDLMRAYELGKSLQQQAVSPDQVVGMHLEALETLSPELTDEQRLVEVNQGFSVLIETLIAYGVAHADAMQLLRQTAREAEDAKFELERTIVELDLANHQMHVLDRAKTQFFSNMSHELRTPLNSIIGFAEDAVDGLAGPLLPKQERYVGNILTAARHLLAVINDILDLAKLQSGKSRLEIAPFPLRELLDEAVGLMQPLVARKRQRLDVALPDGLPDLRADRGKVMQILMNLLSNAHKFTPEDRGIRVAAEVGPGVVTITVADEGIGIAAAELPTLFEEFKQVDQRRTAGQPQGTGLGLAITRGLVEVHGGTIAVESKLGEGTTFRVTLPVTAP